MAENIDAASEFDAVQNQVYGESAPTISLLQGIATSAEGLALAATALTDAEIAGESGSSRITTPTPPMEPTAGDIYTGVNNFLDWLYTQQLQAAVFPTYAELFPDEPPSSPDIDTGNPQTFGINTVARPSYTVPVWDDASAWSGGDISTDESLGALNLPFVWTGGSYTSQLMQGGVNPLYERVKADLLSTDYGIDALDDGRLWDRAREREGRLMAAAVAGATRLFAAGGFSMPTGAAAAALARIQSESRDKVLSLNREIMIKKADLFLEAKKVAVANGLEVEKTTMNFFSSEADRLLKRITQEITSTIEVSTFNIKRIELLLQKYKTYAEAFVAQISGTKGIVEMYAAEVSAEKTKAEANQAIYGALSAKNKNIIDGFVAQLQGFQSVMDARVKYHGVLADVYKTQVSQANTIADVSKGAYDLVEKQQKNVADFRVGKYNAEVAATKTKLDEILGFLNVKIEQLKNAAQAATSVAVGAMSALNVNLSMGLSASTSIGGSENHSYDKTKEKRPGESTSHNYSYDATKSTSPGESRSYSESHEHTYKEY